MPSTGTSRIENVDPAVAIKAPCRVATTANITLSGTQTIDGVAVVAGDRVLVKDQTTTSENGIYVASATAWARATDFDGARDVVEGTLIKVTDGTTYAGAYFQVTTSNPIVPGTTSIGFSVDAQYTISAGIRRYDSMAALIAAQPTENSVYVTGYYGGWAATAAGPKGGHYLHKTGATNTSPTVGSAVAVSTIGTGTQAGYYWDASGDEWRNSNLVSVDITEFGANLDGTDDTTPLQDAQNHLSLGGVVTAKQKGGTLAWTSVNITNQNITFDFDPSILIMRYGSGGTSVRGMITIANLLNANFKLNCGVVDLNGEGCREIGVAGRIANTYATQTTPPIKAISGPLNSLLYALRASEVEINAHTIKNSGEVGILTRNSAGIYIYAHRLENFGNGAIEFNFPEPASDGGTGTVPDFDGYEVKVSEFRYVNDFGLGSGNGTGIMFAGGQVSNPAVTGARIEVGMFRYCLRDFHIEFNGGGYVSGLNLKYNSRYCLQGSLGVVALRDADIAANIFRPCGPGSAGLNTANYPSVYGPTFSSDIENVKADLRVIDSRDEIIQTGSDGAITAGDKTFTSASASFTSADIGKYLAYEDGCETDCAFESRIESINSGTSVELELAAPLTVSGKNYAYGGTARFGVRVSSLESLDLVNSRIKAGKNSGLGSEPEAAGLLIEGVTGSVRALNVKIEAPSSTAGTVPRGVSIPSSPFSGDFIYDNLDVSGFTDNFENFHANRTNPSNKTFNVAVSDAESRADPDSSTDTYGAEQVWTPTRTQYDSIPSISVESTGISSETLTGLVTFTFPNGSTNTLEVAHTSDSTTNLTPQQISTLHANNAKVVSIGWQVKSSKSSSTAYMRIAITGSQS